MDRRLVRVAMVGLGAVALALTAVPPATATTAKALTYVGEMQVFPGFARPCMPVGTLTCTTASTTTKPGPKGEPVLNVTPAGSHRNFTVSSILCNKSSVSTLKPNPKIGFGEPCALTAAGTVWGFCGLFTGMGNATLTNLSGTKQTVSIPFKFTAVGPVMRLTGSAENGTRQLYADLAVVRTGNCVTAPATGFLLAGEVVYLEKTF